MLRFIGGDTTESASKACAMRVTTWRIAQKNLKGVLRADRRTAAICCQGTTSRTASAVCDVCMVALRLYADVVCCRALAKLCRSAFGDRRAQTRVECSWS